jgi:hypothetical protein
MHSKYIMTYECHDNAPRMWKMVQLEKYFDFSLYSHHFSLLSLTSLLSAPEREVTSPSDIKVVGTLQWQAYNITRPQILLRSNIQYMYIVEKYKIYLYKL